MEYYPRLDEHIKRPLFARVAAKYKMSYDLFKPLLLLIEAYHKDTDREQCYIR